MKKATNKLRHQNAQEEVATKRHKKHKMNDSSFLCLLCLFVATSSLCFCGLCAFCGQFFEGIVADAIPLPILVVEVPPLRFIHSEAFGFHRASQEIAVPAL